MKQGDLVRALNRYPLLADVDWVLDADGCPFVEQGEHMIFLGKAMFKNIRILHPVHGVCRIRGSHVAPVQQ